MAKDKKQEVPEEHVYTIPLRSAWIRTGRVFRSKKSVNAVRNFIARRMHAKEVKISAKLNQALWSRGAKKPPGKIRVKASVDAEGLASVRLPEEITLEEEKKKFLKKKQGKKKEEAKEESAEKPEQEKPEEKREPAKDDEKKSGKGPVKGKEGK